MQGVNFYQQNDGNDLLLEQFILKYRPLVKKISLYMKRRLPSHIELEDLIQSGFVGLLEAKQHYKDNMGASFETYASIRIRGAIIDALRKNSWGSREVLKNMKRISEAITKLEQLLQQQPSTEQIATELGVSIEEYLEMCKQISVCSVISLDLVDTDNQLPGEDAENPQEITQKDEMQARIKALLTHLPEREQLVLSLYYLEEFTFKQIGEILSLTEARICQLHSQAIAKIQTQVDRDPN